MDPAAAVAGLAAASGAAGGESAHSPAEDAPAGSVTFESLWRAYGYNRGKKEARAAWAALPAEIDRPAVIEAAAAWQASWAAQGKPDAPRFTLARWLKDERFDEDAPRGFTMVERKAKAKPGKAAALAGVATITSVTETGSPFTNLYADVVMIDGAGRETTRRLHVGALGDDGPDIDVYRGLLRAAPNGKLAGWQVDAATLAPISPPAGAVTPEPAPRPAEAEPIPAPP